MLYRFYHSKSRVELRRIISLEYKPLQEGMRPWLNVWECAIIGLSHTTIQTKFALIYRAHSKSIYKEGTEPCRGVDFLFQRLLLQESNQVIPI
jgi:hypothetical protein